MSDPDRILTDAELELMTILWDLGEGTVRDVMDRLPAERDLAYTTVSTMLRILEQKGFLTARKAGRAHVYVPAVAREPYERRDLRHVVKRLFGGDPLALVRRLVSSEDLSEDELRALQDLVEEKLARIDHQVEAQRPLCVR